MLVIVLWGFCRIIRIDVGVVNVWYVCSLVITVVLVGGILRYMVSNVSVSVLVDITIVTIHARCVWLIAINARQAPIA